MIAGETRRKAGCRGSDGQNDVVVLIPIEVTLTPVHAQVVNLVFGDGELGGRKRIATQTAELQEKTVREGVFLALRCSIESEIKQSKTFSQIKHLLKLRRISFYGFEAIAACCGTGNVEAANRYGMRGLRIVLRVQYGHKSQESG